MLLDKIYSLTNIKEYETRHQKLVLLRLLDILTEGDADIPKNQKFM